MQQENASVHLEQNSDQFFNWLIVLKCD